MKKLFLLLLLLAISSTMAFGQFIEEQFDYPPGDSLQQHGWVTFSGGVTNALMVTSPGLTYTNYIGSSVGNATTVINTGQDAYKSLTSNQSSGSIYTSMIVNVITGRTGDFFASYLPSTSTNSFTGRLYVKLAANGNLAFGISKTTAAAGGIFYGDSIFTTGTTCLLVLKYTFNADTTTDDAINLYAFNGVVPSFEPAPYVGQVTGTSTDLSDIGRFALRQGTASSSSDIIVDGIFTTNNWDNSALPVELTSLGSAVNGRDVTLYWVTSSEINNSGFDIERLASRSGSIVNGSPREAGQWSMVGFVQGNGTSSTSHNYSFVDRGLATGKYNYRLKQIDFNGNFEYFNLNSEIGIGVPAKYDLSQNFPNPFNPSTKINFDLPFDGKVNIKLFDISGREVYSLVNEVKAAGYYTINFNATSAAGGLSSGVYFYTIKADNNGQSGNGGFVSTKKMMLVK